MTNFNFGAGFVNRPKPLRKRLNTLKIKPKHQNMPEISRFLGIVITMYYNEHNPPHFHIKYQSFRASINIKKLTLIEGELPPRVLSLVIEWATLHQNELMKNWKSLIESGTCEKIKPLT